MDCPLSVLIDNDTIIQSKNSLFSLVGHCNVGKFYSVELLVVRDEISRLCQPQRSTGSTGHLFMKFFYASRIINAHEQSAYPVLNS